MQPTHMSRKRLPAAISSSSSSPSPPFPSSSWYSHHCNERFFSSLRRVEDRLASENSCSPHAHGSSPLQQQKRSASSSLTPSPDKSAESPPPPCSPSPSHSAPLFVDHHGGRLAQPHLAGFGGIADPLLPDSSDRPPLELFSDYSILRESPPSSPFESSCPCPPRDDAAGDLEGDVERLMELLGLSELYQGGKGGGGAGDGNRGRARGWSGSGDDQDSGGFLFKIAGVKGPKCRKEMERLDGWIRYYRSHRPSTGDGGGTKAKKEPARLAHLLLARAACTSTRDEVSDYFGGIGFPATVEEYLRHDPSEHSSSPSSFSRFSTSGR